MEFNNNEAAVCTDPIDVQPGAGVAGEIDLYDDLIAFADLSPEEQMRLAVGQTETCHKTQIASSEVAEGFFFPEPSATDASIEQVEVETWAEELERQSAAETDAPALLEALAPPAPIEPVEIEARSAHETGWNTGPGFQAHAWIEPAEPAPPVAAMEPGSHFEFSSVSVERDDARSTIFGPRPSGPLSGFNLSPDIVYTGALSRGVCLACGADSGADDLFCITCGVFIDEIGSTLPVNPTCAECKGGIAADEIFCPWCGSVLAA